MFNSTGGYSLADIAAVTGGSNSNGALGDGDSALLIILFLLILGGGNGRGLFGGGNGQSTGSGITDGYILTSDFATIERKLDSINNGLCDGFYAMNTGMLNGFAGVTNQITQGTIAAMQNTNALQAGITGLGTQLASCCCDMRYDLASNFSTLNYNLADQSCQTRHAIADSTRDLMANQDANTRAILDFMTQDKIATLTSENAALKAAANNAAQTFDIVNQLKPCPVPAYVVANPNCCYNPCGGYNF